MFQCFQYILCSLWSFIILTFEIPFSNLTFHQINYILCSRLMKISLQHKVLNSRDILQNKKGSEDTDVPSQPGNCTMKRILSRSEKLLIETRYSAFKQTRENSPQVLWLALELPSGLSYRLSRDNSFHCRTYLFLKARQPFSPSSGSALRGSSPTRFHRYTNESVSRRFVVSLSYLVYSYTSLPCLR